MVNANIMQFISTGAPIMNGYICPIKKESLEIYEKALKTSSLWENEEIFATTAFGDIIAIDSEGYIILFRLLEGTKTVICADIDLFFSLVNDSEYQKDYFRVNEYEYAIKKLGALKKDECFTYEPLPALGGGMKTEEIGKGKIKEYIQILVYALTSET